MSNTIPERHVVISADCHAGAEIHDYKPYLESKWHGEFDGWVKQFQDPWEDFESNERKFGVASGGADSVMSWDNAKRNAALEEEGIVAEVVFPTPRHRSSLAAC